MNRVEITVEPASAVRNEAINVLSDAFGKKHTAAVWKWKHEDNPYGQSKVVLAIKNHQVIGVRPMMLFPLIYQNQVVPAVQFVDSAVVASERGKGIFQMICRRALAELDQTLVFHTPNPMSYPAYLKMGWRPVGGMIRSWHPLRFSALLKYLIKKYLFLSIPRAGDVFESLKSHSAVSEFIPIGAEDLIAASENSMEDQIIPQKSREWLAWRTATPDGTRFFYFSYEQKVIIIFFIMKVMGFDCVRVLDVLADFSNKKALENATDDFIRLAGKTCEFISVISHESHPFLHCLKKTRPIRKEPVNFVINPSRISGWDRRIFENPKNWALTQSAVDFN